MNIKPVFLLAFPVAGIVALPFVLRPTATAPHISVPTPATVPVVPPPVKPVAKPILTSKVTTPGQVADLLDRLIQPRFADDAGGVFGMDRMYSTVNGHEKVLPQSDQTIPEFWDNETDQPLLKEIKSAKQRYVVAFLHTTHVPGKPVAPAYMKEEIKRNPHTVPTFLPQKMHLSPLATYSTREFPVLADLHKVDDKAFWIDGDDKEQKEYERQWKQAIKRTRPIVSGWEKTAKKQLPALNQGKSVEVANGDWHLFLRPVKATKESCVSCHSGAKVGDTLGVMLYAVADPKH